MDRVIIIGAGQAGGQAAASLRQQTYKGEILLFGDEPHPPYQRPLLSKQYLSSEEEQERIFLRAEAFYLKHKITLRLGESIEKISPNVNSVTTSTGEQIRYRDLILALGSRPRTLTIPGSDLRGIHYLRTLDHVDVIKSEMLAGKKLVIIGGGYIGLEVASVAVKIGLDVLIIETEDRILKRVTTEEMSAFYHQLHVDRGVQICLNTSIASFSGQENLEGVVCGDKVVPADMVIVGIGIVPNTKLAQAAGIACDNGISTDEYCRTSIDNIYAAGDCTHHPNPILGRRLRLESVPNAMEQAKVAASNILGKNKAYAAVPWFWSDQYEHKLQMVGFSTDGQEQCLRGDKAAKTFAIYYFRDQRLVAVDAVNAPADFAAGRQFYDRRFDLKKLSNIDIDIKDCLMDDQIDH